MADRRRPGIHYAWAVCFGCFVIMIFTTPFVNALSNFYLKSVTEDFGISRSAFTLTSTLVGVCGMVFSPLWGKIFSRSNIRTVFSLGLLLFALSYMSYALARNEYHLYLSALVVGFTFSGCAFMPVSILITVWFQKSRGLAMSLALSGIGVGGSVLSPVITKWIALYGWRATYVYMGLMILCIALPIVFFLLRHTPETKGILPYGAEPSAGAPQSALLGRLKAAAAKRRPASPPEDVRGHIPFSQLKRTGFFWTHMLGMFLIGLICSAPLRQINPYVTDLHGADFAATIVSIYAFIGIFGKLILGTINDRSGAIKSSLLAFSMMAISFFLLLFGAHKLPLYLMAVVYGVGNGVGTVLAPLLISATFGLTNFNYIYGITRSPLQLGMSLGGLLLAVVFDVTGAYTWGWIVCILLSLLASACFYWSYQSSIKAHASFAPAPAQDGEAAAAEIRHS